jgi:hypothetical protein
MEATQRGCTGIALDVQRIILYHALSALSFLAWRVEDPNAHDRLFAIELSCKMAASPSKLTPSVFQICLSTTVDS